MKVFELFARAEEFANSKFNKNLNPTAWEEVKNRYFNKHKKKNL